MVVSRKVAFRYLVVSALGQDMVAVPAHAVDVVPMNPCRRIRGQLYNRTPKPARGISPGGSLRFCPLVLEI
eukprot:763226-Hanusia_phi.AAC.2